MIRLDIKAKLDSIFENRLQESINNNLSRRLQIKKEHPDLGRLIDERHNMILDTLSKYISVDRETKEIDLTSIMKEKNANIRKLLKKYGYPENYLEPVYHCNKCKDQGKIEYGSEGSKDCDCYVKEYIRLINEADGFDGENIASFENANFEVFSDKKLLDLGVSQKEYMQNIYAMAKLYCDEFPNNKKTTKNLFIYGGSGLGKTYLINCIKNELIYKKFNVKYLTAYSWFQMAKDSYFGNNVDEYNSVFNCDLLILDDLGTEPQQNNINIPQLFNLINERQNKNMHFLISSNLTLKEFASTYTERVMSRLNDRRNTTIIKFQGEDIRKSMI